jgi:RNA polymerase sigma-70 factor (ECF subfamily)
MRRVWHLAHGYALNDLLMPVVYLLHNLRIYLGKNVRSSKNNKIDIAVLYRDYGDMLHNFIAKKLPRGDAADLMHDTFVRVLCLAEGYELRSPRPFLFQVACNLVLDHIRARRNSSCEVCGNNDLANSLGDRRTPEDAVYAQQRLAVLQQAIADFASALQRSFYIAQVQA